MPEFNLLRNGLQHRFLASKAKIQIFGGGFGNGKTTGAVAKALQLTQYYPGMNCLMARSTYPKLNDTLRKEFIRWCPKEWIKTFPQSVNSINQCTLTNGTTIPFRYVSQQGRTEESTTSNLLSATYDLILVDQIEDPEITFKDFFDLLGRLRGQALYRGTDPTMPSSGPRWMLLTLNPSRNWVFKDLIEPYFHYYGHGKPGDIDYYPGGLLTEKFLCLRGEDGKPLLDEEGKPQSLIELFEGSTYENKHNLPADFIATNASAFSGQMRDRYLLGKWAAYEGLVYPQFDEQVHMVSEGRIREYYNRLLSEGYEIEWLEGYDFGQTAPSCYLLSFVDPNGNIIVVDGFHQRDYHLDLQYPHIKELRRQWGMVHGIITADPDIFSKRWNAKTGTSIADLFWADGNLMVQRGDKSNNAIAKVSGYLNVRPGWNNPFTGDTSGPTIFFNSKLRFIADEMASWFWKKDRDDKRIDTPQEGNDHSLDTTKYMVTTRPDISKLKPSAGKGVPAWMLWHESDREDMTSRRHG